MSDSPQWFVSVDGQQHGPYTGEHLLSFAQSGNIARESLVWTEGMPEWLPAAQIEGLFPPAEAAPVAYAAPAAAAFMRPGRGTTTGVLGTATAAANHGGFPHPTIPAASFGLYAGFIAGGLLLIILALVLMPMAAMQAEAQPALPIVLLGMMVIGGVCILVAAILGMIILHRAWRCLSHAGATVSPGAAVGLLFVPFFNLYWLFRAFYGFSQEWNRITAAYEDTRLAPRMPEGLFLTYCIGTFIPPLGLIVSFPVMAAMCRAINFVAFRPVAQPGTLRFR